VRAAVRARQCEGRPESQQGQNQRDTPIRDSVSLALQGTQLVRLRAAPSFVGRIAEPTTGKATQSRPGSSVPERQASAKIYIGNPDMAGRRDQSNHPCLTKYRRENTVIMSMSPNAAKYPYRHSSPGMKLKFMP
jgi:hypothetical protein